MTKRSSFGWIELILGIILIAAGIITLTNPGTAFASFVIVYGVVAIITGIADIVIFSRFERRFGFGPVVTLLAGILSIIVGILVLFNLGAGAWMLTILFPIWFIVHCISRLSSLGLVKAFSGTGMFVLTLIFNIIGLILGFVLLFNPAFSAATLVYFISFYFLWLGLYSIIIAFSGVGAHRTL